MDKQVTLITGTSKGIGKALKEYYIAQNHFVIGCSRSTVENVEDKYKHYSIDITNEQDVIQMFKDIKTNYKKIDNLINNAGINATNLALITATDIINNVMKINYESVFLFCREAAKLMKKNKYGRIVNFSSILVPMKQMGELAYVSSKNAVEMLSMIYAKELAHYGITVNVIGPSLTETDMISDLSQEQINNIFNALSIKTYSTYEDIMNVVDFFLSPKSSMVTGQKIYLGGIS